MAGPFAICFPIIIVTIMAVNNETDAIRDLEAIGAIRRGRAALGDTHFIKAYGKSRSTGGARSTFQLWGVLADREPAVQGGGQPSAEGIRMLPGMLRGP